MLPRSNIASLIKERFTCGAAVLSQIQLTGWKIFLKATLRHFSPFNNVSKTSTSLKTVKNTSRNVAMNRLLNYVYEVKSCIWNKKQWRTTVSILRAQAMLPWIFTRITHHFISGLIYHKDYLQNNYEVALVKIQYPMTQDKDQIKIVICRTRFYSPRGLSPTRYNRCIRASKWYSKDI